jgi:hypothetical protein
MFPSSMVTHFEPAQPDHQKPRDLEKVLDIMSSLVAAQHMNPGRGNEGVTMRKSRKIETQ